MIGAGGASDTGLPAKSGQKIPAALDSADVGLPCPARAHMGGRHDPGHARARGRPLRRERGAGQRGRDGQADDEEDLRLPRPPAGRVAGLTRKDWEEDGDGWVRHAEASLDFRASSSPRTSAPASASARPRTLWC